jgi:hypothetical protein
MKLKKKNKICHDPQNTIVTELNTKMSEGKIPHPTDALGISLEHPWRLQSTEVMVLRKITRLKLDILDQKPS